MTSDIVEAWKSSLERPALLYLLPFFQLKETCINGIMNHGADFQLDEQNCTTGGSSSGGRLQHCPPGSVCCSGKCHGFESGLRGDVSTKCRPLGRSLYCRTKAKCVPMDKNFDDECPGSLGSQLDARFDPKVTFYDFQSSALTQPAVEALKELNRKVGMKT